MADRQYPMGQGDVIDSPWARDEAWTVLDKWDKDVAWDDRKWYGDYGRPLSFSSGTRDTELHHPIYQVSKNGQEPVWIVFTWIDLDLPPTGLWW